MHLSILLLLLFLSLYRFLFICLLIHSHFRQEKDKHNHHSKEDDDKRPLRIFVPESSAEKEKGAEDYEYENYEADVPHENEPSSEGSEFGSRIVLKSGK